MRHARFAALFIAALALFFLPMTYLAAQVDSTSASPSASVFAVFAAELLDAIKGPVIIPAVASLLMAALNQWTTLVARWPNWAKDAAMIVGPAILAKLAQLAGIDVSSVTAAAGGIVAIVIFKLGLAKGRTA